MPMMMERQKQAGDFELKRSVTILHMTEAPILEIRFKVLGNPTATTMSVPADLTTDSLVTIVADFTGFPPDDISLVYKGRAFKPGDTLASRNVENLSTITVSRKHRPSPPSSDPPPPPRLLAVLHLVRAKRPAPFRHTSGRVGAAFRIANLTIQFRFCRK
jgi:hypothetical protein